ncbi:MAG: hypothetical protein ACM3VT_14695 [Solirubrobacterales bacterium]
MRVLGYNTWVMLAIAATSVGCATRHATTAVVKKPIQRIAPTEVTWGPTAEGLQCRLRPIKRLIGDGEAPTFRVDLRNEGGRVFTFLPDPRTPLHQFAVDGRWYPWPHRPADGKTLALGPGVEIPDMAVTLPADTPSLLVPGWHSVQVAFSFEGVEVVSNAVDIEIVGSR